MKKITKEEVKTWCKEHKKQLIIAGGAAAGIAALAVFNKMDASIPVKNRLVDIIQHSIVHDNRRSHTIQCQMDLATFQDPDKAIQIVIEAADKLTEMASGTVDKYTNPKLY